MSLIVSLEERKVVWRHQIDYFALSAAILQAQYVTTSGVAKVGPGRA